MYCVKCGTVNSEEASFCVHCGEPLARPAPPTAAPPAPPVWAPAPSRLSGMAVASLVLGVLIFPALLGVILGIVALIQINRSQGRLQGQGLAIAGLCVSAFMLVSLAPAMLFPVFARARESARKSQCLSNVKNISMAVTMYLTDYDAMPPRETRPEVAAYFAERRGRTAEACRVATDANPYLRWPVVLDEYVKNRDVWQCPSAKLVFDAAQILPAGRDGLWLNNYVDHPDWDPAAMVMPCYPTFPTGWGGDVTDSFLQGPASSSAGGRSAAFGPFVQGIGVNETLASSPLSRWDDISRVVVCGDGVGEFWNANGLAYPDLGDLTACGLPDSTCYMGADWVNCDWTRNCGLDFDHAMQFFADPAFRKTYTRHLGGSNVGFMDGHAKWMAADAIIFGSSETAEPTIDGDLCACWYPSLSADGRAGPPGPAGGGPGRGTRRGGSRGPVSK